MRLALDLVGDATEFLALVSLVLAVAFACAASEPERSLVAPIATLPSQHHVTEG